MNKAVRDKYTVVIGLEVHAQLLTKSKIFNGDAAAFGGQPNTNVDPISLGHPGTLPLLNKKVVELAVKMGLACNSQINQLTIFDRKNYFYPDLPKGYQLTQDRAPICKGGVVTIKTKEGLKDIPLNRIHMEEDAGKSIHPENENESQIDLNRAGTPLIEIVTEPALRSSEEAGALMTEVRRLVRYLEICDGNMEEGSLRCDANVSVMLNEATTFGKKVEIKNMNSIKNVQRAIDFEVDRQIREIEKGNAIVSETRTFDAVTGKTSGMRTKEELNDYRYFPDPDLSPVVISESWLADIKSTMPQLPNELFNKFTTEYHLPEYDAGVLTESKDIASYFDNLCKHTSNFKSASNWVMGPVKSYLNEFNLTADEFPLPVVKLADLIGLIDSGQVSYTVSAQNLFPELLKNPNRSALEVARQLNLLQESDQSSLIPIIDEVIKEFPLKVEEYQNGKKGIISMFMGEVMKRSRGKADPKIANELLTQKLKKS
jgi:aspartyl-tRNA(Asn)/glutamyl-tRNA(Gln) amidotransferase subunit B